MSTNWSHGPQNGNGPDGQANRRPNRSGYGPIARRDVADLFYRDGWGMPLEG